MVDVPTVEQLREELETPGRDGQRLNAEGVDLEKIVAVIADETIRVADWEAPRILPPGWFESSRSTVDGTAMYRSAARQLKVILSCTVELDGQQWLHVSVSSTRQVPKWRLPNWAEMAEVKRIFLGDREAYQILPPKARYVNINERVLHMFALRDEKTCALPDFTRGTGSL